MKKINAMAKQLSKHVKTQADLNTVIGQLTKAMIETALNAEMDSHLGYEKNEKAQTRRKNTRNGYGLKTLKTDQGEIEIQNPRDREATFEPAIVPKGKTRLEGFEKIILALYARGMTTRQIQDTIKELYHGADVSPTVISNVTDAVIEDVRAWQSRPLDAVYPVLLLDCIVIKTHKEGRVVNQSVYLPLGIDKEGNKQSLGIWISENESAKFWLSVLTELKNRGVKDIIICCVDGLSGFAEALRRCSLKRACNCVSCIWLGTHYAMFQRKIGKRWQAT